MILIAFLLGCQTCFSFWFLIEKASEVKTVLSSFSLLFLLVKGNFSPKYAKSSYFCYTVLLAWWCIIGLYLEGDCLLAC